MSELLPVRATEAGVTLAQEKGKNHMALDAIRLRAAAESGAA